MHFPQMREMWPSRLWPLETGTFWLSKTPDVPGSKGWNARYPRICTWVILRDKRTGKRFCFANTHPEAKDAIARRKGMELIVKRMKEFGEGFPVVFTCDHNCSEDDAPALAVKTLLKDALYESKTPLILSHYWQSLNNVTKHN